MLTLLVVLCGSCHIVHMPHELQLDPYDLTGPRAELRLDPKDQGLCDHVAFMWDLQQLPSVSSAEPICSAHDEFCTIKSNMNCRTLRGHNCVRRSCCCK